MRGRFAALLALALVTLGFVAGGHFIVRAQTAQQIPELNRKIDLLIGTGQKYREVTGMAELILASADRVLGRDHPDTIVSLTNLAELYSRQSRYAESERLYERALESRRRVLGKEHSLTLASANRLALLYFDEGRYGDAEKLFKQTLETRERILGREHADTLVSVNNLADMYRHLGRYGESEPLFKRAIEGYERVQGKEHPDTLAMLSNLAVLYIDQGRIADAEPLARRALAALERVLGNDHPSTLRGVNNLATVYYRQNRYAEAEPLFRRAVETHERVLGKANPETLISMSNLADVYRLQGRFAEAEPLLKQVLATEKQVLGKDHPLTFSPTNNLAELYRQQGRAAEAEALLKQLMATQERSLGKEHPATLQTISNLATLFFAASDWTSATALWRRSTDAIAKRSLRSARITGAAQNGASQSDAALEKAQFLALIKASQRAAGEGQKNQEKALRAAFLTAQWALDTEAGRSLAQMAARGAGRDPKLAVLVRERQDLSAEWQKRDAMRLAALTQPAERRNAEAEGETLTRLTAIDARIAEIDGTLAAAFPNYAALASPEPLAIEQAQAQLRPDEALVLFLATPEVKPAQEETFIWVVTKTATRWVRSDLGLNALVREVRALRCGLDYTAWKQTDCMDLTGAQYSLKAYARGVPLPFDAARAHRLYQALFDGIEDLIKGKHLLVVPSGPLTQLPFQVLVTRPPVQDGYNSLAWLAREHAITILPAVTSLKALRSVSRPSGASKPLIGFANPLLDGDGASDAESARAARAHQSCSEAALRMAAADPEARGAAMLPNARGGLANVADIRRLPPLPETADELCAVAHDVGADPSELRLGERATERELKFLSDNGSLARYRTIHFATHGAMAGALSEGFEPGLVLTPPVKASEQDDGYLSASEIAALKLDADWVILSACNTAAGNASDTEALSGLARAFIYAQARALLVSHWEVNSVATVKLITTAVREAARSPTTGRAEALRRAMLSLIDTGEPQEAHPAYWAPFVLVGEGARGSS